MDQFKLTGLHLDIAEEADKYAQQAYEDSNERDKIQVMIAKLIENNKDFDLDEDSLVTILVASYSYEIGIREGFKQAKELYEVTEQ